MFRANVLIVRRAKIVLYSLWYHHTYRWPSRAQIECIKLVDIKKIYWDARSAKYKKKKFAPTCFESQGIHHQGAL